MEVKVYFKNDQHKVLAGPFIHSLIISSVEAALRYEKFPYDAEVSVTFKDNAGIKELNRDYRGIDRPTDVLSFPMYDFKAGEIPCEEGPVELGDIVISLEKAKEQARDYGHSLKREVSFLTVHSVLHLLGYDHERSDEDEEDMFHRQEEIMNILDIPREKKKKYLKITIEKK